jgi:hypothetical protein
MSQSPQSRRRGIRVIVSKEQEALSGAHPSHRVVGLMRGSSGARTRICDALCSCCAVAAPAYAADRAAEAQLRRPGLAHARASCESLRAYLSALVNGG